MKLLTSILLVVFTTCLAARLENTYLPPGSASTAGGSGLQAPSQGFSRGAGGIVPGGTGAFNGRGSGSFGPGTGGPSGFGPRPGGGPGVGGSSGFGLSSGSQIPIVSFDTQNGGDGNYRYSYETGNGIQVQEQGQTQGNTEAVSGSYSYTGPDGQLYSISYTADESGFHAQGAHIPTPPPIPPEIQRGIQEALAAEARGENQDGSYKGEGSRGGGGYQNGAGFQSGSGYRGVNSYQSSQGGYKY
ncbi:PREDICTED: pupal cuticle protein 20-like isoform X2 [Ceratosolen solmsi marchali]|uniref:Pupal cuticle protein 20-like isoform X2 n=1 Tax=Ceratosolen solmsi marchali TaxID=326594 RepID=A0AAJ7DUI2_9HYME|nr:PREDICTED: pupal cuticle protein 20-like isoform X2 [Ceratosolen solmsi marchali]